MKTKIKNENSDFKKYSDEYIHSLELSLELLQEEVETLRSQKIGAQKLITETVSNNLNLYLKKLYASNNYNDLKKSIDEIISNHAKPHEIELFILNSKNRIENPIQKAVESNLEAKVKYLEEEGIIDWALHNDFPSIIQDLMLAQQGKSIQIVIIPLKINQNKIGTLIFNTSSSKEEFDSHLLDILKLISEFTSIAIDNIKSSMEIDLMYKRLSLINKKMIESSRFASIGELLTSMLRELQQPFLIIESNIKLVENGIGESKRRFEIVNEQLKNINDIYARLTPILTVSATNSKKEKIDAIHLIEETIMIINSQLKREGIELYKDYQADLRLIKCFTSQLSLAIMNMLLFMTGKMPEGGEISIGIYNSLKNQVTISFTDNGIGMEENEILSLQYPEKLENLNIDTIGLHYISTIIDINNGKIIINSEQNKGTNIKFIFPLA
jgi:signal transduction histidine kinase